MPISFPYSFINLNTKNLPCTIFPSCLSPSRSWRYSREAKTREVAYLRLKHTKATFLHRAIWMHLLFNKAVMAVRLPSAQCFCMLAWNWTALDVYPKIAFVAACFCFHLISECVIKFKLFLLLLFLTAIYLLQCTKFCCYWIQFEGCLHLLFNLFHHSLT